MTVTVLLHQCWCHCATAAYCCMELCHVIDSQLCAHCHQYNQEWQCSSISVHHRETWFCDNVWRHSYPVPCWHRCPMTVSCCSQLKTFISTFFHCVKLPLVRISLLCECCASFDVGSICLHCRSVLLQSSSVGLSTCSHCSSYLLFLSLIFLFFFVRLSAFKIRFFIVLCCCCLVTVIVACKQLPPKPWSGM